MTRFQRHILLTPIALLLTLSMMAATKKPPVASLDELTRKFDADVHVLASDAMEGRGLGTKGIDLAADWIETRLKSIGLQPLFTGSNAATTSAASVRSYRQPFKVKTGVAAIDGNRIDGLDPDQWTPLGFSSSGEFSGEIAFVGYGIEAPPIGYEELGGIDLKGKIALMLRYEPQERDDASPFDGRRPSRWSALRYKVHQARERGAVAVVFVTGPLQDEDKDRLPVLKNDGPESPAGLPVVQVKTSVAQKWLDAAGIDLARFQQDVDRDLTPRSNGSTGVKVAGRVALEATWADTANLGGMIPGTGELAKQYLVIGAHYDHLGWGGERSMKPNEHAIHNGADDNASGTVAVLLAAERLRDMLASSKNHRTVVVTLFSGEEVGLAGSSWLVEHPPIPLDQAVAMINLDMVGQLHDDELVALGADSAPQWGPAVQAAASDLGLKAVTKGDGYGPSDQTSFYAAQIPVLHFFTGTHDRYHTPEDDADTLNFAGGARVAQLTAKVAGELALGTLTPVYARAVSAPAMQGDSRGYGSYLGTIPDYRAMEDTSGGVLLSDVRPGGPADLAGIRGGDRIVEMAGTTIENLYDMTFALQDHKPGETIDVVIIRDGERKTLKATLGSRSDRGKEKPAAAPAAAPQTGPEAKAPAMPVAPANPHAGMTMTEEPKAFELPEFYRNRPGKDFAIKAGKPFTKTFENERHFRDIRQITFGGENAEAYFSPDGTKLSFQATVGDAKCDRQFVMDLATGEVKQVSSGKGRTTCGYFDFPEGDRIIYASTEASGAECPPPPDFSKGYVWAVYGSYDLYEANPDGSGAKRLTTTDGYDAEATWCHRGGKLVFTSDRDGDLDLYEMDEAGQVRRLTNTPGYDGGAFYSPDCSEIVYRASRPEGAKLEEYRELLSQGLVRPSNMEIFVMNADGSDQRQITKNGAANFCPYFHPDGQRIIYASNAGVNPREFDLWLTDRNGAEPERITTAEGFDGFPQWSPDGEWIVWASNRADPASHETNLFIARWVD